MKLSIQSLKGFHVKYNFKEFFNFYTVVKSSNLQYLVLHTFLFNFGFVMAEVLSELDLLGVLPA